MFMNRMVKRTYLEVLILQKDEVNVLLLDVLIEVPNLLPDQFEIISQPGQFTPISRDIPLSMMHANHEVSRSGSNLMKHRSKVELRLGTRRRSES